MGLTCLCDFRSVSGWLTLCACVIFLLWEHALDKPQAVKMALLNFNLSLSEKWQPRSKSVWRFCKDDAILADARHLSIWEKRQCTTVTQDWSWRSSWCEDYLNRGAISTQTTGTQDWSWRSSWCEDYLNRGAISTQTTGTQDWSCSGTFRWHQIYSSYWFQIFLPALQGPFLLQVVISVVISLLNATYMCCVCKCAWMSVSSREGPSFILLLFNCWQAPWQPTPISMTTHTHLHDNPHLLSWGQPGQQPWMLKQIHQR